MDYTELKEIYLMVNALCEATNPGESEWMNIRMVFPNFADCQNSEYQGKYVRYH